ncbi:MAG TPA: hypothetical protein PLF78_12490 [Caulobacter sp.]|nr:hypothetical protein [Caulobacter sp.]
MADEDLQPSRATHWDDDIGSLSLSDVEKNGLQVFRNYTNAFQKQAAKDVAAAAGEVLFDTDQLSDDLAEIALSEPIIAVLQAAAVADELLKDMFQREGRKNLKPEPLLGPLGPLGDFNKRLKIAALAGFIDDNDLTFFDELRQVRNRIAHSRRARAPTKEQVRRIIDATPCWLDAFERERGVKIEGPLRYSEAIFKAAIVMHLAKLAWGSVLTPLARKANLPVTALINQSPLFADISRLGVTTALALIETERAKA